MLKLIEIEIWNRLSTRSRRAIKKTKKSYGHKYFYEPRGSLLVNISNEFHISKEQAREHLMAIRKEMLERIKT